MPEDAKFPFEYDAGGDVATVTGDDFYYQHAQHLGLIAAQTIEGEPIARTSIIALQDRMGRLFAESPYFDPPIGVQIISTDNEHIEAEIDVNNLSEFTITI